MSDSFLGIEIGGTKLQIVVGDACARIVQRHRFTVDRAGGAQGILQQIETTLAKIMAATKLMAVGVGFGGPVDWRTGKICRSHHIEGWSGFDLGNWLQGLTGAPVFVDNDANVAALGEARHGAGVNANPVFYITLGSGVGGGLMVDDRIYHGATPGEVESATCGWIVRERLWNRAVPVGRWMPKSALSRSLSRRVRWPKC